MKLGRENELVIFRKLYTKPVEPISIVYRSTDYNENRVRYDSIITFRKKQ